MALEDGRFLTNADRYDRLLQTHGAQEISKWKLLRVSKSFMVIAIGLPVPKYQGIGLDPPFRSRFQARQIDPPSSDEILTKLKSQYPNIHVERVMKFVLLSASLTENKTLEFSSTLERIAGLMVSLPTISERFLFQLIYPYRSLENEQLSALVESVFRSFNIQGDSDCGLSLDSDRILDEFLELKLNDASMTRFIKIKRGLLKPMQLSAYIETKNYSLDLLLAHFTGDICIIGKKGSGKSILVRQFAAKLGYFIELIPLHADLSSRDLLQRRLTDSKGDTTWENSPLVK